MQIKRRALRAAFPYTIPILAGFLAMGFSYGFLMVSKGFSMWYPILMSLLIFAGSMEFVTVGLLLSAFQPVYAFLMAFMVNARHIFYGLSMLEKYKNVGRKKAYLIFGMCDESFSINCSVNVPEGIDRGWFFLFVTLLNHSYWVGGATLGALVGSVVQVNTEGIEFTMTALITTIFLNQWMETKNHIPALVGVISAVGCLLVFGKEQFMIPAMLVILLSMLIGKKYAKRSDDNE